MCASVQRPCEPLPLRFTSVGPRPTSPCGRRWLVPPGRRPSRAHRCVGSRRLRGAVSPVLSAFLAVCRSLRVARVAPAPLPDSPCRHGASPFGSVRPAAWFFVPVPVTPWLAACALTSGFPSINSHEQPPLSVCRSLPDLSAVFLQSVTLGWGGLGSLGFQALRRVFYAPFRSTLRQLRGVAPAASRPKGQRCAATSSTSFVRCVGFSALARVFRRHLRAWDESFVHPLPMADFRLPASALAFRPCAPEPSSRAFARWRLEGCVPEY